MKPQSAEHPPSRGLADPPLTNLPEELSSFVGRATELAELRELLGETRLLTLIGAGGCGKTRLAHQSAAAARERFPDGVWWVELAALEDAELLPNTIASALGLRDRPGQAPLGVLREHLRERQTLLVLDNCEHLLEACAALVDTLLRTCPGLVVLATTREPLGVPGELTYRVPSLNLPSSASLADASRSDAVDLFADRAAQARPSFEVTEDNASAIVAICRELDGIPLAIELAAARLRMFSPRQLAGELGDRFRLLTGGARTVAPRHQTLRASIDWSHELCSEQERILLRRLSVWVGGFTLDGAEAVSVGEALDRSGVLEALTGLVEKSLVDTEERSDQIRYGMLETIRQYAAERLADAGEVEATQARHIAWCLELAERAEPELVRHDARAWLKRLEPEAANFRAALERALASDRDAALRLAAALTFFWLMRGRFEEGTASLARALDTAPRPSATRGKVLWALAELNIWRGHMQAASENGERAFEDGEAAGDRSVMARGLKVHGLTVSLRNNRDRRQLERSLVLAREAGDEWCTADSTRLLAATHVRLAEHDQAQPLLEEGYALARALGYPPLYAWYFALRAWGGVEHGRLSAAREFAEDAIEVANEIGDPVALGMATAHLVECDVLQGVPDAGRARGEPCAELMRSRGLAGGGQVWVGCALALVDVAEGRPDAARARTEALLPLIEAAPSHDNVARAQRRLAVTSRLLGDLDGAEGEAERLLSHARAGPNEYVEAIAHNVLGRIAMARGDVMRAEGYLHEALAIAARRDFRLQTLNSLESLAVVAALSESAIEAARLLAAVRAAREQLGAVRWPPEPDFWAGVEEDVRTALGDEAFAAAAAEGRALSVEEAVQYARSARGERKRPSSGWESLTPAELEVVRHAAAGLTNPQIGERMFISRATVKAHLSHIFTKLGTSSRTELAAEAAKRGLDPP